MARIITLILALQLLFFHVTLSQNTANVNPSSLVKSPNPSINTPSAGQIGSNTFKNPAKISSINPVASQRFVGAVPYRQAGLPNYSPYSPAGYGNYGGTGAGNVLVTGELPAAGTAGVIGQVPVIGGVQFGGNVMATGSVTIRGTCAPGGY